MLISSRSENSRRCVIDKILSITALPLSFSDKGISLFLKAPELFVEWKKTTDILATVKATEAMDTLIDCLNCNDGRFGLGIGQFPATKAIVKFGDQAIPKLERALEEKPPEIRRMAVQALHAIGGEKARLILIERLKTETSKSVADTIRNLLLSRPAKHDRTPQI